MNALKIFRYKISCHLIQLEPPPLRGVCSICFPPFLKTFPCSIFYFFWTKFRTIIFIVYNFLSCNIYHTVAYKSISIRGKVDMMCFKVILLGIVLILRNQGRRRGVQANDYGVDLKNY